MVIQNKVLISFAVNSLPQVYNDILTWRNYTENNISEAATSMMRGLFNFKNKSISEHIRSARNTPHYLSTYVIVERKGPKGFCYFIHR